MKSQTLANQLYASVLTHDAMICGPWIRAPAKITGITDTDILDSLINMLASSVGSLTNPQKIFDTFKSKGEKELSLNTINSYIADIEDSFIVNKSTRYDIKGKKYIQTPQKYYFSDIGLRNARLNFRQNVRDLAILELLISTGMRVGELFIMNY